ncbi:LysR family transcriptional regulator [Staphylococcus sp. SQ8-PEA]|uniref:LysR family transcriptional regulator n=1 Tax=Staphylococcus marylandisciuri TaxID=2981529 RepID=A0ABT2QMM9_9STAP|nr:LysR family transcriptional regulator [Staphylococcus marylandisciuri]MCU5745234.1 LysR family transcriptional regulator [Staphylococcus marylandisciuri]
MKIIQLEYFIAVVDHNSFTKAADFLHISQPSLTATIKKMEERLGYDLFYRTTKQIQITEKGIQFYHYAINLVHTYSQTMEKMHDLNLSSTPKIKIAILESTSQWMSQVLSRHSKTHHNQRYMIAERHDMNQVVEDLLNFNYHFAISNEEIKHELISSIPLYRESYVLLTPKDTFNNKQSISIENLPLIVPNKGSQVRKHLEDYCTRIGIHPNIIVESDRFETALNYVHRGMGYAVLPRVYYQSYNARDLDAYEIRPKMSRHLYINYLMKRQYASNVQTLIDECLNYWDIS